MSYRITDCTDIEDKCLSLPTTKDLGWREHGVVDEGVSNERFHKNNHQRNEEQLDEVRRVSLRWFSELNVLRIGTQMDGMHELEFRSQNAEGLVGKEEAFFVHKRKGNAKESNHGVIPTLIPLLG